MQLVKKLNISADDLFKVITQSVQHDIFYQTGDKIEENDLKNYEYIKTFKKNSRATIRIVEFKKNLSYHYTTETTKNSFLVKYSIEALSARSCKLIYSEEVESYSHMQKLNDALVGTLLNHFKKKRFMNMLRSIETTNYNNIEKIILEE